jgi:hypothetical protein
LADVAGFLNSAQAELSGDIPPPSQLRNCSTLQQIHDKLCKTVYFIIMCHTRISKIINLCQLEKTRSADLIHGSLWQESHMTFLAVTHVLGS